MKSNYEPLGKHIQLVDYRNSEEVTSTVLGISIDKEFIPSVANVIGTDLSRFWCPALPNRPHQTVVVVNGGQVGLSQTPYARF